MDDEKFNKIFPFNTPRDGQREIIQRIIDAYASGKTHVILQAPTGTGKSVIAYTVAKYLGNTVILTSQKILQEQYYHDLNIPYVLGRSNYKCNQNNELTCEMGVCKRHPKLYCSNCPYLNAKEICLANSICNLNYSYYLGIIKTKKLAMNELIVCDECHNLETELIKTSTIKLSKLLLEFFGIHNIDIPNKNDLHDKKMLWLLNLVLPRLVIQYNSLKNTIEQYKQFKITNEYKKVVIKLSSIQRLISIIKEIKMQEENNQKIIINMQDKTIEFKVLFGNNLFDKNLKGMSKRFLHMSATVLSKEQYCKNLGLDLNDVEYIECESVFPVENRLIHYIPVGSLTWTQKAKTIPKLVKKVQQLLQKHSDEKGIIHTVNYNIAQAILASLSNTKQGSRLLMPKGNNRQNILNLFYKSRQPYVLISPSLTQGLDLKEDLSRFCIICKVPYANITDEWVKERANINIGWYNSYTAETLIQMTGRSIRSEQDHAISYILDESFINFASRNSNLFPDWWKKSVVEG